MQTGLVILKLVAELPATAFSLVVILFLGVKKQCTIFQLSTEAKYRAMASTACELT